MSDAICFVYTCRRLIDLSLIAGLLARLAVEGRDFHLERAFGKLPMLDSHAREYILQPSSGRVDVALGSAPWQPQASVRGEIKDMAVYIHAGD